MIVWRGTTKAWTIRRWNRYGLGALPSEILDVIGIDEHDLVALCREMSRRSQFEMWTPAALVETTDFLLAEKRRWVRRGWLPAGSVDLGAGNG